jgi:hypothetical protein
MYVCVYIHTYVYIHILSSSLALPLLLKPRLEEHMAGGAGRKRWNQDAIDRQVQ